MIIKELFKIRKDGVKLFRTYSDDKKKIMQVETGNVYDEAIDIEGAEYTYIETDETTEQNE